ncbi:MULTISPECIES: Flp family type IVb pilin [Actinoplanes]|uniref:Flp family type IVb pilin n=1 Tax=Actinoplanes TaxID=1865 RepID=UPI0005F2BF77|nr:MULTISPECIES: Flp family type IVb pilin [Actinoplanes]GLY02629.1 hypothetical protein Acsp01_30080 [Actinoplanes sp. NBRC 101535]
MEQLKGALDPFKLVIAFLRTCNENAKNDEGATAVEYSLLAALIAGVIVVAVTALGGRIRTLFNTLITALGGTP